MKTIKVGGLAGRTSGVFDGRPPLALLHGLSFNRAMWNPTLDLLFELDPARQVLALDLPGHGDSDSAPRYDIESVAEMVHDAVHEAGLVEPVMVGHSLAAIVATVYASAYPVQGVVNVDQTLQTEGFAKLLHSLADQLMGPDFMNVWQGFNASFHLELLPPQAQQLLRDTSHPTQELVTGYWREVMEQTPEFMRYKFENVLENLRDNAVPYLVIAGSEPEVAYLQWLTERIPQATIEVFPASGHFPHLADPHRFATVLAATAPPNQKNQP
ncbi:alpha/beta fold hydrolase [Arthrobacter sp. TWP1-1]|uniref:alpha/beta fold hydrolase n=1 Tax=Arthrobacter sp. TWP1-1 TaxID=2804568 RepID=UPI003CF2F345